jgi:hypothetical protein
MPIRRLVLMAFVATILPSVAAARTPSSNSDCRLKQSDAQALVILSNYYPGYWWDHTHLTIAVQAHPSATRAQLAAIHDAIATWTSVLNRCFDGFITLTDVTDTGPNPQQAADIVVHYVPTAGGVVFGGFAVCGAHGCPNIIVRSDLPPSLNRDPYDPEYLGWVTMHEVGHALGLGHTTNLLESIDLMGYGWPQFGDPILSQCDIDALRFVFTWAFQGSVAFRPSAGPYVCRTSRRR